MALCFKKTSNAQNFEKKNTLIIAGPHSTQIQKVNIDTKLCVLYDNFGRFDVEIGGGIVNEGDDCFFPTHGDDDFVLSGGDYSSTTNGRKISTSAPMMIKLIDPVLERGTLLGAISMLYVVLLSD